MEATLSDALNEFDLPHTVHPLGGGSTAVYRAGPAVLKRIQETSLENNHSPALAAWIAEFSARLPQHGFRLPSPLHTGSGAWITSAGWMASRFISGRPAEEGDIPACLDAITALHQAVRPLPKYSLMDDNRTAWGYAHRHCWGDPPARVQPVLRPLVEALYARRLPIQTAPCQLIHGDLNPANILITPSLPPAMLDFSPFWAPPEFGAAIFANFIGLRRRSPAALAAFAAIPNFYQLLVRAALRMLLVVSALDGLHGWEASEEKWAAECVIGMGA